MKKNIAQLALATGFAAVFAGCISYTGEVMPGDDMVDEGNRPFVVEADQNYKARQQFRRQVIINEAEGMGLFLSPQFVPRTNDPRANALCYNLEVRRTMIQSAKAKLREAVGSLKDLELVGDAQGDLVNISTDDTVPSVYRITYNISGMDMQRRGEHKDFITKQLLCSWVANVSVELRMIDPTGKSVFTFNAMGTCTEDQDASLDPNPTMLETAAVDGIDKAIKQYALKFAPPMYVTDTCQNGEFARLNFGTDYGLRAGMKVEFFNYRAKQGLDGNAEMVQRRVGTGTIGEGNAPVERDYAWVHVDDYDAGKVEKNPQSRTVYQWTSAKLLKEETKSGIDLSLLNL